MARHSITLYPFLETAVRERQAKLLMDLDCDVSFTEALNMMVLAGWVNSSSFFETWKPESIKIFLDSGNLHQEALLDSIRDAFPSELVQQMQALQPGR